jgi:acyl carrier protein
MTEASLLSDVIDVIRSAGKVAAEVPIDAEKRLVDDLGIDSLDLVGVFLQLQDQYDVVIDDDDLPNLRRVIDLADYIQRSRAA